MKKIEKIARAIHKINNDRSEPDFRVEWEDCMSAYREIILNEAAALDARYGGPTTLPFDQQPPEIQEQMLKDLAGERDAG